MHDSFDIIIIGGGLAGLSLAIQSANANRKVAVIEKKKYPFHRVCGEYVSMESWNFLERIGMPLGNFQLPRITQLQVSSVTGNMLTHDLDPGGFGISRYMLDYTLAEIAKAKGALIMEETRAEEIVKEVDSFFVKAGQKTFKGKVVIGAFGKRSIIDRKLERSFAAVPQQQSKNWVGVKYHVKAELPANLIQLHNFDGGYCGISKVEGDHYCLCYLTKADKLRKYGGNIRMMEDELLSKNKFLKKIFADRSSFLFDNPETISQIIFENKLPVEKNVLMAGDASGMIAPLCGNGMSMAFHAAAICFPLVEEFLSENISRDEMEMQYASKWKKKFAARLKVGRSLQPLLVKSDLSIPVIAVLKHFPFLVNQIVKLTHGKSF